MWAQRHESVSLATGEADEYRYCLDALIVAIREMRDMQGAAESSPGNMAIPVIIGWDIAKSEARAADLAGRLFDRYIEELP